MKLPATYISYSQWWLFTNKPKEYYQQYYVAKLDKPTPKMILGTIFQEAWCDKAYNYKKALKKHGFTREQERVIETALNHPQTIRIPKAQTEITFVIKGMGLKYPIMVKADGFVKKDKHLIENKMGRIWTKEEVETAPQLTWYALGVFLKEGFIPELTLQSFNSRNGIPTVWKTKRTKEDFKFLIESINDMHDSIVSGDFLELIN